MSKPIDNGGMAFPRPPVHLAPNEDMRDYWYMQDGMSRRDWLAGIVLPWALHEWGAASSMTLEQQGYASWEAAAAAMAYRFADAMIAEGRKEREDD